MQNQTYVRVVIRQIAPVIMYNVEYKSHKNNTVVKYEYAVQLLYDSALS